ncbi:MAG: phospholipase A [Muribaculaceae bacterium]|nr:phospholipase A [Muribaculaceae bacterium]
MRHFRLLLLFSLLSLFSANAQIVENHANPGLNTDSLRTEFDKRPLISMYKDNYFIFGGPTNHRPDKENTNVKFQISLQCKLTKSTLPLNTYLFLYYTQKVFWNVLENSMPMTDLNFNPGIGLAKPLFSNNRYIGKLSLMIEHESNGRDSIQSRSWNRISFGVNIALDQNLIIHGKAWIPIVDGQNNRDLLDYYGIYQAGLQVMTNDRRWKFSEILVKRRGWKPNYNSITEVSFRFLRNADWNLFFQYYNGYGEGLLDYNKFKSQARIGIVFRPNYFSDY